jgi:hypothetical protein
MHVERARIEQISQFDRVFFGTADTQFTDETKYVDFG